MNPTKYSKMTFKKIYSEIKKKLNIKKIMNYSYFIEQKCFVKSSHGLHYGKLTQDEYDYVILEDATLFIPESFEELCPELCTIEKIDTLTSVTIVKHVPFLQINNVKEIAVVDNTELITYYDSLPASNL